MNFKGIKTVETNCKNYNTVIYDLIVMPTVESALSDNILMKEAKRALLIAQNAVNFKDIESLFRSKGVTSEDYD